MISAIILKPPPEFVIIVLEDRDICPPQTAGSVVSSTVIFQIMEEAGHENAVDQGAGNSRKAGTGFQGRGRQGERGHHDFSLPFFHCGGDF